MEKSEEIIREKEPELYRAIVPFVEQMPSFGRGATQDNWTQMRDELETATVASVEGKGDLSLIRTIFAGDMKTMRPFLIGDLREFFRAYPALLWLASRVAPEETIVPLAIFQNRIDLLPSSFDVKKAIPWIRSREMAKHLHGLFPSKTTTTSSLEDWAGHGNLGYVLWGLEEVGPNGEALMAAIISDNSSVVRAFLEDARSDPGANKNEAIRAASRWGKVNAVRELLKDERVDPSANEDEAIRFAAQKGYVEVVRELLKDERVDPSANKNEAIKKAAEEGHVEVVRELLKDERVDPTVLRDEARRNPNILRILRQEGIAI